MHIAVYAFDSITMFHLSIPQMVFDTVSRLGLADWQVSLFTPASELAVLPAEPVASEEGASLPPTAPSSTAAIRTSGATSLVAWEVRNWRARPTSLWSPRGSLTAAPPRRSCAHS